jgi:hypothetical protein
MFSIDEKTTIPTNTNTNPNTNTDVITKKPEILRGITSAPSNILKLTRQSSTGAYRSITSLGAKPEISGNITTSSDKALDIDLNGWLNIQYEDNDLVPGNKITNSISHTLSVGSIGTQLISSKSYNYEYYDKQVMPTFTVKKWETDRKQNKTDTLLEKYFNTPHEDSVNKNFYDFFAVFQIGNTRIYLTYKITNAIYKGIHLGSHSGDITEDKVIRVNIVNLDGSIEKKYITITKLRHTIILNIPNLVKIAETEPVAVFFYNAGYIMGSEHKLDNYIEQETVCDVCTIDDDNNKKKYLFEAPIYTTDSENHSAALVSIISIDNNDVNINVVRFFSQGIATKPEILHSKIKETFWATLTEVEPALKAFDTLETSTKENTLAEEAPNIPQIQAPIQGIIRRSFARQL